MEDETLNPELDPEPVSGDGYLPPASKGDDMPDGVAEADKVQPSRKWLYAKRGCGGCLFLILLLAGGCYISYFVSIPDYLPLANDWERLDKQYTRSWGLPCVYVRYRVPLSESGVIALAQSTIPTMHEWRSESERSSEEIAQGVRDRSRREMPVVSHEELVYHYVHLLGVKYAMKTNQPFTVLRWGRSVNSANNHSITIRIIPEGAQSCIVEVWDFQIFDH